MKKVRITILIVFIAALSFSAKAANDYLWAYSTWFSSSAVNAAREATPVIEMTEEEADIYRLGFAAGYDTAQNTQEIIQLKDATLSDDVSRVFLASDDNAEQQETYIINTETNKFHIPGCRAEKQILPEHRKEVKGTFEEVRQMGYSPCGICFKGIK